MPFRRRPIDRRINLSSNELIHPGIEPVLSDISAQLGARHWGRYASTTETVECVAAHFGVDPAKLVLTPGSDLALRLLVGYHRERTSGRGAVVVQEPNYPAVAESAVLHGLELRAVPADFADPAAQGAALLEAARSTDHALVAVSVPNGPAGGHLAPGVLDELTRVARERGHLLVVDSCYQVFDGPLAAQAARAGGPVVVVQSLSKSHALAGARIAALFGDPGLLATLSAGPLEQAVSGPSLVAAQVAIGHRERLEKVWHEVTAAREDAARQLAATGRPTLPSGGNFLTLPLGAAPAAASVTARLSEAGYRVRDLSGTPGLDGCVRFTVGDARGTADFLDVLRSVLPDAVPAGAT